MFISTSVANSRNQLSLLALVTSTLVFLWRKQDCEARAGVKGECKRVGTTSGIRERSDAPLTPSMRSDNGIAKKTRVLVIDPFWLLPIDDDVVSKKQARPECPINRMRSGTVAYGHFVGSRPQTMASFLQCPSTLALRVSQLCLGLTRAGLVIIQLAKQRFTSNTSSRLSIK